MSRTQPALGKTKKFIWILHKIMEIICFSSNVHQCIIADSVVHVQLSIFQFRIRFSSREQKPEIEASAELCNIFAVFSRTAQR